MPTITLDLTPPQMNRAQKALGEVRNLTTPGTPAVIVNGVEVTPAIPGVSRDATAGEVRTYVTDALRTLVQSREREKAQAVALAAIAQPTAFDPT